MRDLAFDRRGDQRARLHGVVEVVAERIGDRFRHHDRAGEMDDGVDAMASTAAGDQRLVADVALDETRPVRHRPAEPGRQIVEHHDLLAGVEQLEHHVAADIAGAAGDQNAHEQSYHVAGLQFAACYRIEVEGLLTPPDRAVQAANW